MTHPDIFVLSGPNGAGKSTTAKALLSETLSIEQFVNADLIAQGLSPFAPMTSVLEAGRIMHRRIRELRECGQSFAFETTLASQSYARFLADAQQSGFVVHLAFVSLCSPEVALSRVAARVQQGGHDVPRETVRRRSWRGLRNFFGLYRPLATTWTRCDDSSTDLVVVARGDRDAEPIILDKKRFDRIREQASHARQEHRRQVPSRTP